MKGKGVDPNFMKGEYVSRNQQKVFIEKYLFNRVKYLFFLLNFPRPLRDKKSYLKPALRLSNPKIQRNGEKKIKKIRSSIFFTFWQKKSTFFSRRGADRART